MKALLRHLFDAITAMSLLVVLGTIATQDEPQPRNSTGATPRGKATTLPVVKASLTQVTEPIRQIPKPMQFTVTAKEPTPVPPPSVPEPRSEPVKVAQPESTPIARGPVPTTSVPYEREPEPVVPHCTPGRWEIMQYWKLDLVRARSLARVCSNGCLKKTFGATYKPLMNAVQRGANGYANTPEPPESYANIIIKRYCQGGCHGGSEAGNPLRPLTGEMP